MPSAPENLRSIAPLEVITAVRARPRDTGKTVGSALAGAGLQAALMLDNRTKVPASDSAAPPASNKKYPLRLTANPPGALIKIAGQTFNAPRTIKLEAGSHRASMSLPGCPECGKTVDRVTVKSRKGEQKKHLSFRYSARLRVDCAEGSISHRGKVVGQCGATLKLPVDGLGPQLTSITVNLPSGPKKKRVTVNVSKTTTISVR